MAFIHGIPTELYISSAEELAACTGDIIWATGQGGVSRLRAPYILGTLTEIVGYSLTIEADNEITRLSLRDWHVMPNDYNNWYLCKTENQAQELYNLLRIHRMIDPDCFCNSRAYPQLLT